MLDDAILQAEILFCADRGRRHDRYRKGSTPDGCIVKYLSHS